MIEKLVLDAAPLLSQTREELLSKSTNLFTTPAVFNEIKDEAARQRLDLIKDNLTVQQPSAAAIQFVTEFSKKTGDHAVLSAPDIGIIALTYDLHPDQSLLHKSVQIYDGKMQVEEHVHESKEVKAETTAPMEEDGFTVVAKPKRKGRQYKPKAEPKEPREEPKPEPVPEPKEPVAETEGEQGEDEEDAEDDDDWITPENVVEKVQQDSTDLAPVTADEHYPVALASNDFAVQNVTLQIGLQAIGSSGMRIKQLKLYMQRCHACFHLLPIVKDQPTKQFCPRCGGHTLTRVTVSVKDGKLHLHLKANMQWKTRGDRYSVPKPQSQRARRQRHDDKVEFYAEDQPEYQKAVKQHNWQKRHNQKIVDQWIGPGTLETSESPFVGGRQQVPKIQIGRGRNANAK